MQKMINNLLDQQNLFFINSIDESGFPNSKAMLAPRKHIGIKVLYFTTAISSKKVQQITKNNKTSVYFCDPNKFIGVLLLGEMEILTDEISRKEMWRDGDELYHPKGVNDPDYCVLMFTTESCRIYQNLSSEDFMV